MPRVRLHYTDEELESLYTMGMFFPHQYGSYDEKSVYKYLTSKSTVLIYKHWEMHRVNSSTVLGVMFYWPLSKMPLLINHPWIDLIARWRIKLSR